MKTGRIILLDCFFNFVIYSNFLTIYNFFYSLAVFVFSCNFSFYSNFFEVIFLANCHCNKTFCNFTDFFCFCFCGNNFTIV